MNPFRLASRLKRTLTNPRIYIGLCLAFGVIHYHHNVYFGLDTETQKERLRLRQKIIMSKSTIFIPSNLTEQQKYYIKTILKDYKIIQTESKTIMMTNHLGDSRQIQVQTSAGAIFKHDFIFQIANFNNPPASIVSIQQLNKIIINTDKDQSLIFSYIPKQAQQIQVDPYDKYTASKIKNLGELETQFKSLKYDSTSSKSTFIKLEDGVLAKRLGINQNNIGDIYVLKKTSHLNNNQSNFIYQNIRYHISKVETNPNQQQNFDYNFKRSFIREAGLSYINQVNLENDYLNLLRSIQASPTKKVLLIYTTEDKPDFIKSIQKVLVDLKKMFRADLNILFTRNKIILEKHLNIHPDQFVTLRLLDFSSPQKPNTLLYDLQINPKRKIPNRYIHRGPFKYAELIKFIKQPGDSYYQQKRNLKLIDPIMPQQLKNSKGIIIFQKKGCKGCIFFNRILEQLQEIVKQIKNDGPKAQEYVFKYKIFSIDKFKNVRLHRYNILNEDGVFYPSTITPEICFYDENKNVHKYRIDSTKMDKQQVITDLIRFLQESY